LNYKLTMNKQKRKKLINTYINKYNLTYKEAEHAAMEYERLTENEGWGKNKSTKEFAVKVAKQAINKTSRPKTNFKKHNKTSYRQSKSIAREEVDNMMDNLKIDSDEEFLKNAKKEFDDIKDSEEETSWNSVRYQIEKSLRKELHKKPVKKKMVDALRKHSNYNYTENELHVEADRIIRQVSENKSEFIKDKILLAINDKNIKEEEETIKNKLIEVFNKENFWKGTGEAIGKNIFRKVSDNFIHILAAIITAVITGGNVIGIL